MSPPVLGIVWALMFAVPVSLLSRVRLLLRGVAVARVRASAGPGHARRPGESAESLSWSAAGRLLAVSIVLLFSVDTLAFFLDRPVMTFIGLVPLIIVNLLFMAILAMLNTFGRVNAGSAAAAAGVRDLRRHVDRRPQQRARRLPGFAPGQRHGRARRPASREQHGQHGDRLARHRHHQGLPGHGHRNRGPAQLQHLPSARPGDAAVRGRQHVVRVPAGVRRRGQQGTAERDRARIHHGVRRGPERIPGRALRRRCTP